MSRSEKREYFKEQRILARASKPKEETSGRAEITVDSSTTMDTETMAVQIPTVAMDVRQEIHPDDQGSVSSAPGCGVEESKEEAPEEDIVISIQSSKSAGSSQYPSQANESAFLQNTRAGYDLMGQLMSDMGVVMDTSLKYFLKVQLSISQEIIDCLVILLLTDAWSMMDFAMHPSIPSALRLMPLSGFTHPAVLPALMVAWAFGANWNRLILQYGKKEVDLFWYPRKTSPKN